MVITGPRVNPGPLTREILEYDRIMRQLVATAKEPEDWAPLAEFVAVGDFERVGTLYRSAELAAVHRDVDPLGITHRRSRRRCGDIPELPDLVYYEIKEHHIRGDNTHVMNTMTVFTFNGDGKSAISTSSCSSRVDIVVNSGVRATTNRDLVLTRLRSAGAGSRGL